MRIKCVIILLVFATSIFAENILIQGKAPFYPNRKITLNTYDDLVSFKEVSLKESLTDDSGNFSFALNDDQIKYAFLKIGKSRGNIYLQPNASYNVFYPMVDSSKIKNPEYTQPVDLYIMAKDTSDINLMIIDYNKQFDEFWEKKYKFFLNKQMRPHIDSFRIQMHQRYKSFNGTYFFDYVDYDLASIEESTISNGRQLAEQLIANKPIRYNNYVYMKFLNTCFKNYLYLMCYKKEGAEVFNIVNGKGNFKQLVEYIKADQLLAKDSVLRELIAIKGLQDLYYVSGFDREKILSLLNEAAETSHLKEHEKISRNIITAFSRLAKGSPAPNFTLSDKNGNRISLSDYKGKFVYLDFWATWCGPCLGEMKLMTELHKKFGKDIVFLSVSVDKEFDTMKNFLEKNPKYAWNFVHYGDYPIVKDEYNIKSLPTYFMIDPNGNLLESPAKWPKDNIEEYFEKLLKRGNRRR